MGHGQQFLICINKRIKCGESGYPSGQLIEDDAAACLHTNHHVPKLSAAKIRSKPKAFVLMHVEKVEHFKYEF